MDDVHAYDLLDSTYGWDYDDYEWGDDLAWEQDDLLYGEVTWEDHNGLTGW